METKLEKTFSLLTVPFMLVADLGRAMTRLPMVIANNTRSDFETITPVRKQDGGTPVKDYQVVAATAIQLFTLGIPCVYYGSEQAFAGPAQSQWRYLYEHGLAGTLNYADRYLREAMFGPEHPRASGFAGTQGKHDTALPGFGAFGTAGAHVFDRAHPAFVRIKALISTRKTLRGFLGAAVVPALRIDGWTFTGVTEF